MHQSGLQSKRIAFNSAFKKHSDFFTPTSVCYEGGWDICQNAYGLTVS
jgi:hypothetical protein